MWIVLIKLVEKHLVRQIVERAVVMQIFHKHITLPVIFLKDRVAGSVKLDRIDAKKLAKPPIKCRRRLQPSAIEEHFRRSMEYEIVFLQRLRESFGGNVIAHDIKTQ